MAAEMETRRLKARIKRNKKIVRAEAVRNTLMNPHNVARINKYRKCMEAAVNEGKDAQLQMGIYDVKMKHNAILNERLERRIALLKEKEQLAIDKLRCCSPFSCPHCGLFGTHCDKKIERECERMAEKMPELKFQFWLEDAPTVLGIRLFKQRYTDYNSDMDDDLIVDSDETKELADDLHEQAC